MLERMDDKDESKNADDDGRNTVEQVRSVTDDKSDGPAAEFRKIDGAKESDGNADYRREQKQLPAANDSVGHAAAGLTDMSGQFDEEVQSDGSSAVINVEARNEEKD